MAQSPAVSIYTNKVMLSKLKCLTHEQSQGNVVAGGRAQHNGREPKVSGPKQGAAVS